MLTDLWTFKDRVVAPTMLLGDGDGPQLVKRVHLFCGFPMFCSFYTKP
jgi:hypothetical protein